MSFGGCTEGVGGPEYVSMMRAYANRWVDFLRDIAGGNGFTKDQWQFQMHCRALERVGKNNLFFFTGGLGSNILAKLSVNGKTGSAELMTDKIQAKVERAFARGLKIAVFPEGPYRVPVERMEAS